MYARISGVVYLYNFVVLSANISSASMKHITLVFHFLNAGRENAEERGNGEVCDDTCYNVLRHVSALDSEGNTIILHQLQLSLLVNMLRHSTCTNQEHLGNFDSL